MANRPKVFGHLLVEVIRPNRCVVCGSCASVCPTGAISIVDDVPKLTGKCDACGTCYLSCPRVEHNLSDLEETSLGRKRTEKESVNGVIRGAYAVKTLRSDLTGSVQDGGAVTSLLLNSLAEGGATVAAGLEKDKAWSPIPIIAKNESMVIDCAGTKYTSVPMLLGVTQAEKEGLEKLTLVSTPCQIHGLRRRQNAKKSNKELAIGLFCMETFDYNKLMAYLREQGVEPTRVKKFEIKSGRFIAHREGEAPFEVKIKRLKEFSRQCCKICQDYTSELADISVGNVGSPNGWSTVLVRTERGEAVLESAKKRGLIEVKPLSDFTPGMDLVNKLSDLKKRENASKPLDQ